MSELTFAQPERRSFLLPAVIAIVVLAIVIGIVYSFVPHRVADLTLTHVAVLPEHTVFSSDSKVVGQQAPFDDDLYITFPALVPLSSAPLLRESTIQPAGHTEGMVLLHYPIAQAEWDQRKSASIILKFYNQDPLIVPLPKQ